MKKLFGTDGIRGIANVEPITAETALKLGRAAAYVFKKNKQPHTFVIGKDTRLSGYLLENALAAGICSMGDNILLVGPLPTPAIAFITRSLRADAGIVISASHNSYEYNGIKFFSSNGYKLPDEMEAQIENLFYSGTIDSIRPTAENIGKAKRIDDAAGRYVEFVKNTLPKGIDFCGLKIVLDCANGADYKVAPSVFRELGAKVFAYEFEPDGLNINRKCGALYPENLAMKIKEHKADVGFAFDGDGDRVMAINEKGEVLDGDHILMICGLFMKNNGELKSNTIVTTIMANMGLDAILKKNDINLIKTNVGDRYVIESMVERNSVLGGEQSGHIIFRDFNPTGDGLVTAVQIARIMVENNKKLSELGSKLYKYPQYIQNIKVEQKIPLEDISAICDEKKKIETLLGDEGRVIMRYSGTEPLIRIMIESIKELNMHDLTLNLVKTIKKHLNGGKND